MTRQSRALGLVAASFWIAGELSAFACPPGTVFSANGRRGLCLYAGQGLSVAVTCSPTGSVKICPAGYTLENRSTSSPIFFCCPATIPKTVPSCNSRCDPLLTSVTPKSEANRVHNNCMTLCSGNPDRTIICPDNTLVHTFDVCPKN